MLLLTAYFYFIFKVAIFWKRNSQNIVRLSGQEKADSLSGKGGALILVQMCLRSIKSAANRNLLLRILHFQSPDSSFHCWKPGDEMSVPVVMSCTRNKLLNTSLYGRQSPSLKHTICSAPNWRMRMKRPTCTSLIWGPRNLQTTLHG